MTEVFAHLHVHSDFTLSKGASKVAHLVAKARDLKIPAMALTDDGNMFGAMEFSKQAAKYGVQPIIGSKLWFDFGERIKGSVLLLAQNDIGYSNLCYILGQSNRPHDGEEGGQALIPTSCLDGRTDGIILLTGGRDGFLSKLIKAGRADDAVQLLDWLRLHFCDRVYVEISRDGNETQEEVDIEEKIIDMAYDAQPLVCVDNIERTGLPLVATSEVWYTDESRHGAFEILKAVESKSHVAVQDGEIIPSTNRRYPMRSAAEMKRLFADLPEAYENAGLVARRCAFKAHGRKPILPTYDNGTGRTEAEEMRLQAQEGLNKRLRQLGVTDDARAPYDERLEYELGIIENMQFPGYFLIVADFIKWAKSQGIPVGPGRGSGAGSLVAYSLYITDLDPLQFGLLFERFLNPERVSMPDFDIDFCQDRRGEVIAYVREKYGADYVSAIQTFGEIKSKNALKDVGRVLKSDDFGGYGFGELNRLTGIIPMNGPEPKKLADAMKDEDDTAFRDMVNSDEKYRVLLRNAASAEGLYRNTSTHAAGIVIAGQRLDSLVPVGWDNQTSMSVCQFNMKHAEEAGLVKFDFLGLKTLSVIRETLENIRATTGEVIDLETLALDDAPTYAMLAEGRSNGVFQFESEGMKKWFKVLKPSRFEDLIALAALYRPGPMDMIPTYVNCKNGHQEPNYPEPVDQTKPFLEETFGIMVYQEQVMQVAQVVGGYSLGGADLLRRAMGKKIPAEMVAQRALFIKGATENGTEEKTAGELFDLIAKFAGYGFNKSHAAAYALIAYHTAWLKKHYPAQFMAALLSYETSDPKKMARVKDDMDAFGIEMLLPCIDRSDGRFKPEKMDDKGKLGIRFGLTAINGVSGNLEILKEARKAGPFASLTDFYVRAGSQFNKGALESLVAAGTFDGLIKKDKIALNRYSAASIFAFLAKGGKKVAAGQDDLFGGTLEVRVPAEVGDVEEWGDKIDREFSAVGFYFGEHPLDIYEKKFRRVKVKRKASLVAWMQQNRRAELKNKRLAGLVEHVERKISRNGKHYVRAKFLEKQDSFYCSFFLDTEELESVRLTLENAKEGRRPVVVVADIVLKDGDDITLWGREVLDADALVSEERGRTRIVIDAEKIHPSLQEQRALREARQDLAQGSIDEERAAEVRSAQLVSALERKLEAVKQIISQGRDDSAQNGVSIIIRTMLGDAMSDLEIEGLHVIDQGMEIAIKAADGVVSMAEELA